MLDSGRASFVEVPNRRPSKLVVPRLNNPFPAQAAAPHRLHRLLVRRYVLQPLHRVGVALLRDELRRGRGPNICTQCVASSEECVMSGE